MVGNQNRNGIEWQDRKEIADEYHLHRQRLTVGGCQRPETCNDGSDDDDKKNNEKTFLTSFAFSFFEKHRVCSIACWPEQAGDHAGAEYDGSSRVVRHKGIVELVNARAAVSAD